MEDRDAVLLAVFDVCPDVGFIFPYESPGSEIIEAFVFWACIEGQYRTVRIIHVFVSKVVIFNVPRENRPSCSPS